MSVRLPGLVNRLWRLLSSRMIQLCSGLLPSSCSCAGLQSTFLGSRSDANLRDPMSPTSGASTANSPVAAPPPSVLASRSALYRGLGPLPESRTRNSRGPSLKSRSQPASGLMLTLADIVHRQTNCMQPDGVALDVWIVFSKPANCVFAREHLRPLGVDAAAETSETGIANIPDGLSRPKGRNVRLREWCCGHGDPRALGCRRGRVRHGIVSQ